MRKIISFVLMLSLVMASFGFVFAKDGTIAKDEVDAVSLIATSLKDVAGTKYEDAVTELVDGGIISGYTDGSFLPNKTINRAESCVMVVKLLGVTENELKRAPASGFPDMVDPNWDWTWASQYVNYAAAKGIISGYTDGTFKPAGDVTYAEMASMLVRALGYKLTDLKGVWPENFMNKAEELGLMKGVYGKADEKAIRGDVALMSQKTLWKFAEKEDGGAEAETPLANYSGRAYGILLDVAQVLNDKEEVVAEYEFLFGSKVLYIKTNGKIADPKNNIEGWLTSGAIVALQMSNGVATKIGSSVETPTFAGIGGSTSFEDFTTTTAAVKWAKVKEAKNNVVELTTANTGGRSTFTILEDASIYVAKVESGKITGYKPGSFRDIKADKFVRIYSVTGKNKLIGEIVLVTATSP